MVFCGRIKRRSIWIEFCVDRICVNIRIDLKDVPRQYIPGTAAPFVVGADVPDRAALFTAFDTLIAQYISWWFPGH
jgi:hypothetical protein